MENSERETEHTYTPHQESNTSKINFKRKKCSNKKKSLTIYLLCQWHTHIQQQQHPWLFVFFSMAKYRFTFWMFSTGFAISLFFLFFPFPLTAEINASRRLLDLESMIFSRFLRRPPSLLHGGSCLTEGFCIPLLYVSRKESRPEDNEKKWNSGKRT